MQKKYKKNVIITLIIGFFLIILYHIIFSFKLPTPDTTLIPLLNQKQQWYENYDEIPNNLTQALVAVEDRRFRYHPWFDPIAILRAAYQTIREGNIQGASTIDQQTIKLTQKHFTRSMSRKVYEIWRAFNLQFHYSKDEILLAYVNAIPFSHGIVGRKSACTIYLHKSCELLSDSELSYLMAISQMWTNPYKETNTLQILWKWSRIANQLIKEWLIESRIPSSISLEHYEPIVEPRIQDFIMSQDIESQKVFDFDLYKNIDGILKTTKKLRDQYNVHDCCVIILDRNGKVKSMNLCSSRDDEAGKINVCLKPRQTGSAIKPFLYLFAFKTLGLIASDTIIDEAVEFDLGDGNIYSPKNFDLKYHGKVSLAFALGNSLNVPAIKLVHQVGVAPFLKFLKLQLAHFASGMDENNKWSDDVWLSVALGTYEITPLAFTQIWRLFLLGNADSDYIKYTKQIVDILSDPRNKITSFGQDNFLDTPGRAVKTGTSRKFIDGRVCWIQLQKGLTMCIWMGNYNNDEMKWPSGEVASYLWRLVTQALNK